LIPIGLPLGIYLFWVGADAPGNAFAGGAVLSAMAILGYLAGVYAVPVASGFLLRLSLAVGVAVFLLVGLAGLATGSGFLTYPDYLAKPVIVVIEIAMTLSIAMTLALLVVGPPGKLPER
jgi:multisubunit Na+/H+ antiporter MnhB subunit